MITPTTYGARIIADRLLVDPRKVNVVTGAAGQPQSEPTAGDIDRFRRRFSVSGPFIIAAGHLERRKNLGLLIDAVRLLDSETKSHHHIVLVGGDHGSGSDIVRRANWDPTVRLTVTGILSEADKMAALAGAECLVIPSLVEGFGIVAVEAMSVGCPVLGAQRPRSPRSWMAPAFSSIPSSPMSCDCLRRVLGDPDLRSRMSAQSRQHSSVFRWTEAADVLHSVYAGLAARPRGLAMRGTRYVPLAPTVTAR